MNFFEILSFSIVVLAFVSPTLSTSSKTVLEEEILNVLMRRPIEKAKCRSVCLTQHKIGERGCLGDCQSCWNFCNSFSEDQQADVTQDCNNLRGCVTAHEAFFGRNKKEKNSLTPRGRNLKKNPDIKFTRNPEFDSESCHLRWSIPTENRNAISFRFRKPRPDVDIVFVVFGKDFDDRWYEIGQTSKSEMKIISETSSKFSELRLIGVTASGVIDEAKATPHECFNSTGLVTNSRLNASTRATEWPSDPYFTPLVIVCSFLALACLSVFALILRTCFAKRNGNISAPKMIKNNLNSRKANNNFNNNNNVSVEIFEEMDPTLQKIFTIDSYNDSNLSFGAASSGKMHVCHSGCLMRLDSGSGKSLSESDTLISESKLNAHVCFARCGLGPEYLDFVKNTNL